MRRFLIGFLFFLLATTMLPAQNKSLLYDFTEIPQALLLNPGARTGYQWFAGIPFASGNSFQGSTSGLTVNDLFANDGLDFNQKVRERAVYGLSARDDVSSTIQLEIFSGGFRNPNREDTFYSFGLYYESDFINYWPRDLAILGWEGNANRFGERFQLGHLKIRGEALGVFHFGVNRQVNRFLTLGARAKLYSGIVSVRSSRNSGYFSTNQGVNNLVSNTLVADMKLQTSGIEAIRSAGDDGTGTAIAKTLTKRGLLGGDLGLGIDLGFNWALSDQLHLTGSLLDLGFMVHHTDVRTYTLEGRATVEGVEVILPDALADPSEDFWQGLVDEIEALIPFEENNDTYITFRPTRLYSSLRYDWGEPRQGNGRQPCDCDISPGGAAEVIGYRNAVGGQVFMVNRPRGPQAALTAFYLRRIGNVLALKTTFTADKYTWNNIGLGINVQAGPVQFYLLADNLLGYRNIADSHTASLQIGLNILSWGRNP